MNLPLETSLIDLGQIETLAFAGGGNRCWWQAGLMQFLLDKGWRVPINLVGTSAGASIAASCVTSSPAQALSGCKNLYSQNSSVFDWQQAKQLRLRFAHRHIYPSWVESFVTTDNFQRIQTAGHKFNVALCVPAKFLGMAGSISMGTVAYLVDKYLWHSIHPRLPRLLGLRQLFVDVSTSQFVEDVHKVLCAAAAAPPFMPSIKIEGVRTVDGGYVDNAPLPAQDEQQRHRTLVLLTRFYPKLPQLFQWQGRTYLQPSNKVPVSTWDCTYKTTVDAAFEHGLDDAKHLFAAGKLGL